jgi:hypothetical protein
LGGQAAVSLAAIYGNSSADINGTLSGTLGPIPFSRALDVSDSRDAFGDLFPQFALRWNSGVNNWMTYLTGDIPVGAYALTAMAIGNQFGIYAAPNIKDQVEIHLQEGDQMTPRAEGAARRRPNGADWSDWPRPKRQLFDRQSRAVVRS